jgi:hypothetical protein
LRDIGALHTRLVPCFVVDTKLEPGARVVTFADGRMVSEHIEAIDDDARHLVWTATGERLEHHNASAQVIEALNGQARIVWIADPLPDSLAGSIGQMME